MVEDLREQINSNLKDAMKSQDKRRLSTLRLINAAFKDREIQNRGTGQDISLNEGGLQEILAKMIKQRRESAATYQQGGRPELADGELAEIGVIEEFLPRQMDEEEMSAAVKKTVTTIEAAGLKDMGRTMSELKKNYAGQMDFSKACAMVKELLG